MAIQTRRGPEKDFDANKLLSGEFAGTTDTKRLFYAFAAGDTKELATKEDFAEQLEEINSTVEQGQKVIEDFEQLEIEKTAINDNESSNVTTYSSNKILALISGITGFTALIVDELPVEGIDENTIYFVKKETEQEGDIYDEYLYVQDKWEHFGSTDVDLTQYYTKEESNVRDLAENVVAFESNDIGPDGDPAIMEVEQLKTGETMASFMQKVSKFFTNMRHVLKLLGTTDISSIGDGTITGCISDINDSLTPQRINITSDCLHNSTYVYRIARLLSGHIYLSGLTLTANTSLGVGTIDAPPPSTSAFPCMFINVNNTAIIGYGILQISSSGNISVRSDVDMTSARCICNLNYVIPN